MNRFEINEKMVNNLNKMTECYLKECSIINKKQKKYKNKIELLQNKAYDKYEKKEITKKEFERIFNELEDLYYANINTKKFINCKYTNCKNLLIEELELFLLRLNKLDKYNDLYETKQENYNVDDYINIRKLNTKFYNSPFK